MKPDQEDEPASNKRKQLQQEEEEDDNDNNEFDTAALSFGTFDFSGGKPLPTYLMNKKKKKQKLSNEQLLKKVEEQKKLLEETKDTPEGQKMAERQTWTSALKRASGEKVKDDVSLLKKTVKREHKMKERSAKKWSERNRLQKTEKEQRIEKRMENIRHHKEKKHERKMGKKPNRPGFEGKKQDFINKEI